MIATLNRTTLTVTNDGPGVEEGYAHCADCQSRIFYFNLGSGAKISGEIPRGCLDHSVALKTRTESQVLCGDAFIADVALAVEVGRTE